MIFEKTFSRAGMPVRIQKWLPNVLRVSHSTADGKIPADRPWMKDVFLAEKDWKIETDQAEEISALVQEDGLTIRTLQDEILLEEVFAGSQDGLAFRIDPGERFYGWGEWFNAFCRKTGSFKLNIRDALSLLQGRHTYSGIPLFFSSRGYALFLLNSSLSEWTIDPPRGVLEVQARLAPLDYLVLSGTNFKQILQTYTALTGRPPLLPRWALGLWVTSYPQGDQETILRHVEEHRKRNIPLDAVILDYHWEERFHNFRWRKKLIPRPDELINRLKQQHIHLGLITTPFVNGFNQPLKKLGLQMLAKDIPPGMVFSDDRALPEYREVCSKSLAAHEKAAWWFGKGAMIDFTNPQACQWWRDKAEPLYAQGVDFFKNDDGEYLPEDAHAANGMPGSEYHNLYGFYYGKAMFEGVPSGRRPMIYARSVWAGSQRYPAVFMGDQKPSFDCMQRTLRSGLNLSLQGFAYWTADVFGLDGKTTPETHIRYAQWALLNPIARYFWRPAEIDDTRFPWSHNKPVEDNFRFYAHLRSRLLPLYTTLAWEACQTGLPLVRPMLLEYPQDNALAEVYDQYLLGDSLLIAPVVQKGAARRTIRLPQGLWHDFWSSQSWQGPAEIEYPAPLERLPILVRGGSILPSGPDLDWIAAQHSFSSLVISLWPPFPARGQFYEDDGLTLAYQQGAFRLTRWQALPASDGLHIQSRSEGRFVDSIQERQIEIVLYHCPAPKSVNGAEFQYDSKRRECRLSFKAAPNADWDIHVEYSAA